MKKCSACAKDLPDTAMHCVFCGAKQAPMAPANPQAKTVMGYSAADLLKQAGIGPGGVAAGNPPQGFAPPQAQPAPYQPPQPAPYQPPAPAPYEPPQQPYQQPQQPYQPPQQPYQQPQAYQPPQPAPYQPPQPAPAPYQPPAPAPYQPPAGFPPPAQGGQFGGSASTAATMFMQSSPVLPQAQPQQPQPQPMFQQPQAQPAGSAQPFQPATFQPQGAVFQIPPSQPYTTSPAPQPAAGYPPPVQGQPPFLASQTASRADKPVEPFNDAMKMVALLFGGLLIAAFVVPMSLDPGLGFMWDAIGSAPGLQKLGPLLIAGVGVLGVLIGVTPMAGVARGGVAALLGLVPIGLFLTLIGSFEWHMASSTIGGVILIAGLLMRNEYTRDPLPKLFITIGAAAIIVTHLVPLTVVDEITAAIDAPGLTRLLAMLSLGPTVIAVLALILAWIPGSSSVGAKPLAWTFLMWPAILQATMLIVAMDEAVDLIKKSPNIALMLWTYAAPTITGEGGVSGQPGVAFMALAGFGLAVMFGKQLEMKR